MARAGATADGDGSEVEMGMGGGNRSRLTHEIRLEVPEVGEDDTVNGGEDQGQEDSSGSLHEDSCHFAPYRLVFVQYDPRIVAGCR